jgi:hypothetical protein
VEAVISASVPPLRLVRGTRCTPDDPGGSSGGVACDPEVTRR